MIMVPPADSGCNCEAREPSIPRPYSKIRLTTPDAVDYAYRIEVSINASARDIYDFFDETALAHVAGAVR
jgi:hypothetical protein